MNILENKLHCFPILPLTFRKKNTPFTDICMEEGKPNPLILSASQTNPSILLLHTILCDSATDNVCSRG
jgi:hypothetical protein